MKRLYIPFLVLVLMSISGCRQVPSDSPGSWHKVESGPFYVWNVQQGRIESRDTAIVMSSFAGGATVVSITAEGTPVQAGDILVEFDSSTIEREIIRQRRDVSLARSDLETLEKARQPVELRELEAAALAAHSEAAAEEIFLKDSETLFADGLVSDIELEQQRQHLRQLQAQREAAEGQLQMTRDFLHPSAIARAQATLDAAEETLRQSLTQLSNCVVRAPASGTVVHTPLHIGAEYRTIRVGDTLYKNQPFLEIPDFSNLIIRCSIPEAALVGIAEGSPVLIIPAAFPDLRLKGRVEHIGSMAQAEPGRADWQRFFSATLAMDDHDPRLRTGMSATCQIMSYRNAQSLSIPRRAITWREGSPFVTLRTPSGDSEEKPIEIGHTNATSVEILSGLAEGNEVRLP